MRALDSSAFDQRPAAAGGQHALRRAVLDEVHARPFQLIATPRRVLHQAFVTDAAQADAARAALRAWCETTGAPLPEPGANFHRVAFPTARLRFERHTEFTTFTWDTAGGTAEPFAWPLTNPSPVGAGLAAPGALLVAIDLALVPAATAPADLTRLFDEASLCTALVHDGAAMVATDFRQDERGFTRILVVDRALSPALAGSLVQRLLEIETYRTFALLGLPEAQRVSPIVSRAESVLIEATGAMRNARGLQSNSQLLDTLVALAAEIEGEAAVSAYRFAATRAYDAIVRQRLEIIGERAHDGHPTLGGFLDRRMAPAMRTCQSVADRQADLSRKLTRAAELLRTRVHIEMESQNKSLLEAMNDRAKVQLRLQQTVEGLSVAAVSYYVLGLLGYLFKAAKDAGMSPFDPNVATGVALPFVVFLVWWTVRRVRRSSEGSRHE